MSAGAFANNIREFETLRDFFTSASLTALVDLPFLFLFMIVIFFLGGPVVLGCPRSWCRSSSSSACSRRFRCGAAVERGYREASQKHAMLVETINGLDAIKVASAEGRRQRDWNHYVAAAAARRWRRSSGRRFP